MILRETYQVDSLEYAMAAKPSIDPVHFLHEQLASASPDLLRAMLSRFIDALMGAEADAVCGARYGVSSPERVNTRNGYRPRGFRHPRGHDRGRDPQAAPGQLFPGLAAGAP